MMTLTLIAVSVLILSLLAEVVLIESILHSTSWGAIVLVVDWLLNAILKSTPFFLFAVKYSASLTGT